MATEPRRAASPPSAGAFARARDAVLAGPNDEAAFNVLRQLLLDEGRFALLAHWIEWRRGTIGGAGVARELHGLVKAMITRPLYHALALHLCQRAGALAPEISEVQHTLQFLHGLPAMVSQAQRELRAAAVEERDRRRAAQIYLQIAELAAVYDQRFDRVRENLDRCFLLWGAMPAALATVEALSSGTLGPTFALEFFVAQAKRTTERTAAAELWIRAARAATRVGSPEALRDAETYWQQALQLDPTRAEAAVALVEKGLERGEVANAEAILLGLASRLSLDPEAQAAVWLLIVDVRQLLGNAEGARAALAEVLRFPSAPLAEISRRAVLLGDGRLIADVRRAELSLSAQQALPVAERVRQLQRLAELQAGELGQPSEAFDTLAQALMLDPELAVLADAIEKVAIGNGLDVQLVALYRELSARPGAPVELARRLARRVGEDRAAALSAWRRVIELQPGDPEATAALRDGIAQGGSEAERETALRSELENVSPQDVASRLRLLRQIAALARDPGQRAELFEEILRLDTLDVETQRSLLRERLTLGQWVAAERSARTLLGADLDAKERLSVLRSLAAILGKLGRLAEALPEIDEVLRAAPTDDQARRLLETLVERHPDNLRGIQLLAEAELAREELARAAALFLREADLQSDPQLAVRALRRAARIYEENLVDRRAAQNAIVRALRLDPALVEVRAELVRLSRELSAPAEAAQLLLEIAGGPGVASEVAIASAETAAQLATEARSADLAAQSDAFLLRLRPNDSKTAGAVADRALREGKTEEALGVLRGQVETAPEGPERAARLMKLAQLQKEQLADPLGASESYRQALANGGSAGEILGVLADALLAAGRVREAVDVLGREVGHWAVRADPPRAVRVGLRRARVARDLLGDLPLAVEAYRDVLSRRPGEPEAIAGLEELLGEGSVRRAAATVLAQVHEQTRNLPKLAEVLEVLVDGEADVVQRSALLRRIAGLYAGELRQPDQAFGVLSRAARLLPRDDVLRAELSSLAKVGHLQADYVALLEELVQRLPRELVPRLLREAATISEADLHDLPAAKRLYAEALAVEPEQVESLEGLLRIARDEGELATFVELGERLAAAASTLDRRAAVLRESARAAEKIGDGFKAIELWHALLQELPDDAEGAGELERLSEAYGVVTEKAEALAKKLRQAGGVDAPEGRRLAVRLAQVRRAQADHQGALELLRSVLDIEPAQSEGLGLLEEWAQRGDVGAFGDQAFDLLDRILAVSADGVRRAQNLELRLERLPPPSRPKHYLVLIEVLQRQLAQPQRAFAVASRAFAESPEDAEIAQKLEELAEVTSSGEELGALWEDVALRASEETARGLRQKLAERAQGKRQWAEAARHWVEILLGHPADERATQALEALEQAQAEDLASIAGVYATALARLPVANPVQIPLLKRVARLFEGPLRNPEFAAQVYERWVEAAPGDSCPLQALVQIWRSVDNPSELSGALARVARLATTELSQRKELWLEVAGLRERLSDQEGAMAAYREILEIDPRDPDALNRFSLLLGGAQRWDELVIVLSQRAEQVAGNGERSESAELRLQLAIILEQHLNDLAGALSYYQSVLEEMPGNPKVLGGLERVFERSEQPEQKAQAAQLLAPLYERGHNLPGLVSALQAQIDGVSTSPERAKLLVRLATLYLGPADAPEMGFLAASRALKEDPEAEGAVELAAQGAVRSDAAEDLAQLLEEVAPRVKEPRAMRALHWSLAELYEGPLKNLSRAIAEWRKVVERNPEDQAALERLAALYLANNDVASLLEVFRRQLAVTEDLATRQKILHRIGEIQVDRQKDLIQAFSTYRRLLELVPDDQLALARLDELCVRQQRWPELAQILESEARIAEARKDLPAAVGYLERLGEIREGALRDVDGAVECYARCLELSPAATLSVERLEAILSRNPQQPRVAEILEGVHKAGQNWAKVAAALEARVSAMPDPQARRDVWIELAQVYEQQLARADLAFLALARAFKDDPADAALRSEIERVAEISETTEELLGVYEEEIDRQTRPDVIAALALRIGLLQDSKLGDPVKALQFLEKARELDVEAAAPGLQVLERIYREAESFEKLAGVLEELSRRTADLQEQAALLFRLGQLAEERLGSLDRAALAYEALLKLEPRHLPALRSLERLYEQAGRWKELLAVLEQEQQLTPEGQAKDRLTAHIAEISSAHLGDDQRAIQLWSELLQKNPRAENALNGLETALERQGKWAELAEFLKRRLNATVDPREITRLNDKLGSVLGLHLGKADEAIQSFKAVLERDPRNRRSLEALRDIYAARAEREELAGVLRRLIPLQEDATGVKAVRLQLAQVLAALGRREEAIEAARRALDLEPHQLEELLSAEAVFKSLNALPEVARAMEARAATYPPERKEEAIETYFGVAELYETSLKKPEGGASALERVFELDPGNGRAFEALKRIYQKTQDYRRYCALLDKLANQAQVSEKDVTIRVRLLCELAAIQETKLGQKDLAFLALCRAFQALPSEETVVREVRRLARETGTIEELTEVYQNVIDDIGAAPEAEPLLLQLAEIQDQDLDAASAAEETLRRLLALLPGNTRALDGLAQLFLRRGRSREYVVALEQKVEQVAELEEKKAVIAQLAKAYDELLHEPEEAVLTLRRGLELDPADLALTAQLANVYRREKAFPDLVALLQRARETVTERQERSRIQLQIAEITEVELHDDEAALSAYQLGLELDPQSLESLHALERLYTKLDRAAELLRVYDRQLDLVGTPERAKVLFKSAQVWEEKLQNAPNAIACFEGVLAVDPRNTRALHDLARLYRQQGDFERLASTLQRHIAAAQEGKQAPQDLVALHVALGTVLHGHLQRSQDAEQLYLRALEIDPTGQSALRALGELYESKGHWPQALEMIRREVRLAATAKDAVALYTRAGRIQKDELHELDEAISAFRRALEIDPSALPALQALKTIFETRQAWDEYLDVARQEATVLPPGPEKTERLFDVARFYQETRQDTDNAESFYREALTITPDHLPSARPLADIYVAAGAWQKAEEVLGVVVRKLDGQDARELCRQYYRLGYVADKLGHHEAALAAYRRAYELDATYLPALEGLGHLLVGQKQFEEALKIFQAILIHHREELTDLEVVEIYWQIGEIHRGLGQNDRAQKSYEKSLEIDPAHEPSHQALAELLEALGNYDGALEHRQKLLDALDGDARFDACVQVARLSRDRLGDPYQAVDAFVQALKIRPDSLAVLDDLLALYRQTKQGQKAIEVLQRMLEHPEIQADAQGRRDMHYQLAILLRDDVKDFEQAIVHFNFALDADPAFVDAFAAIEGLLSDRQDWASLEQAYHAMLQRLPKTPETHQARMALWRTLGELYHKVLKNTEGALVAYEVVAKAEPNNGQVAELLADLYAQMPGKEREAIEASRVALRYTSDPVKISKTLVRLHATLKDYDKAFVAAQVVVHLLGERSPDEEQIIARLKRYAKEQASRALSDRMWSELLYHERLRGPMAEILALCQETSGGAFAVDATKLNVNKKRDRVDVQSSMLFFANMFKYVSRTLAMDSVELYKVAGQNGLVVGNTFPVCYLAGENMFKDRPKRELWFTIAKALAFSRPELAMARLHPPEHVEAIVQAAVSLAIPGFRITADPQLVAAHQQLLGGSLSEAARPALFRAAREAAVDPQSLELRPYLEAVEHTANRVGVLLCGDVEVGMRCISQDQGAAARLPLRSKVRDLMLFCMSENYSKLRSALGLAVEVKVEGRATPQ